MNRDEAILKARKLLRLGESDNPNEAANAMAQAQKILDEYEINQAMLDEESGNVEDDEAIEDFANKKAWLDEDSRYNLNKWRVRLASVVAKANQCKIYTSYTKSKVRGKWNRTISIVGRPSDVEKVRYLYQYFKTEVTRLSDRDGKGCGNSWRNNYRHGVVDTLSEMLQKNKQEMIQSMKQNVAGDTKALVKIDNALSRIEKKSKEVEIWVDRNLKLKSARRVPTYFDPSAREQGQIAGREIKISEARGALKGK